MPLNETQEYLLKTIIDGFLDDIKEMEFDKEGNLTSELSEKDKEKDGQALAALKLIFEGELTDFQKEKLNEWHVFEEGMEQIRRILDHPAPQNCPLNGRQRQHGDKEEGLLSLTAHNDDKTAAPVTKNDVVEYIRTRVDMRIKALEGHNIKEAVIDEPVSEKLLEMVGKVVTKKQLERLPYGLRNVLEKNASICHSINEGYIPLESLEAFYNRVKSKKLKKCLTSSVLKLMSEHEVSFDQIVAIYDENPKKLIAIADVGSRELMSKHRVSFDTIGAIYDENPQKLQAVTDFYAEKLMSEHEVSFDQIVAIYDENPQKLTAIAYVGPRRLMSNHGVGFDQIVAIYDENPKKLSSLSHNDLIWVMKEGKVSFETMVAIYDENPDKLEAVTAYGVPCVMYDQDVSFEQILEIYDADPNKLEAVTNIGSRRLMEEKGVTFEQVLAIYDKSPEVLDELINNLNLSDDVFSAKLLSALPEDMRSVDPANTASDIAPPSYTPSVQPTDDKQR